MSEDDSPLEQAARRGRGRPKGSLNKKTLAKQEELRQATTLDVSFEEEPQEPEEPDASKPKIPERVPVGLSPEERPETTEEEEEEEAALEPEEPAPKPKQRRKAVEKKPPRPRAKPATPEASPPMSYLQVLQRGLVAARAAQRLERVQRYDAYFSHL